MPRSNLARKIIHTLANDIYTTNLIARFIEKNICPDNPESVICCDVRNLNFDALEKIDALAFGFTCNNFSIVGKKKGFERQIRYRRRAPDKPAYTMTCSGGGGTHIYQYVEPRALTNRERARLQTFPGDFIFAGSKENIR